MRIYILDSERREAERLQQQLLEVGTDQAAGEIKIFNDAEEFLHELIHMRPGLVFIRVGRIGLNGLTIAKQVRELDRMAKIVLVSNFREYAIYAYDVQAVDYLLEPFEDERLRETLQRA